MDSALPLISGEGVGPKSTIFTGTSQIVLLLFF